MNPVYPGVVFTGFITLDEWQQMTPDEQAAAYNRGDAYFFPIDSPDFTAALDKFRGYPGSFPQLLVSWQKEQTE